MPFTSKLFFQIVNFCLKVILSILKGILKQASSDSVGLCVYIYVYIYYCIYPEYSGLYTITQVIAYNPDCSLEGLMLKLKFQNFSPLIQRANSLEKILMMERLKAKEEGSRGRDG